MAFPKVSEVLTGAADLIEQNGWVQGVFSHPDENLKTCYCAGGAMSATVRIAEEAEIKAADLGYASTDGGSALLADAYAALADSLGLTGTVDDDTVPVGGDASGYVFAWNDKLGRTKADVIAGLRTAAEAQKLKEEAEQA